MKKLIDITEDNLVEAFRKMYKWMSENACEEINLVAAKYTYFEAHNIEDRDRPYILCYLCEGERCCLVTWSIDNCDLGEYGHLKRTWSNLTPIERSEQLLTISNLPRRKQNG